MSVPIEIAVNHVVLSSGRTMTAAAAPRVVYAAHVAFMGLTEGGLLVQDRFFATPTGPNVPRLAELLLRFKGGQIRDVFKGYQGGCSPVERRCLDRAWADLGHMTPEEMFRTLTAPGTGWARAYERNRVMPISDRQVFEEFMASEDA